MTSFWWLAPIGILAALGSACAWLILSHTPAVEAGRSADDAAVQSPVEAGEEAPFLPSPASGATDFDERADQAMAVANGIPVVVIGQPENIFHRGVTPGPVADWHEACLTLVELAAKMPTLTAGAP